MLGPIVCFTCGVPLGDKEDLFKYLMEISKNTDPLPILNMLDIINECCKMHFITPELLSKWY